MKKIVLLGALLFVGMHLQAQDLNSLSSSVKTSNTLNSDALIDSFAKDQVGNLTKSLNLSDGQQSQISSLITSQLKTEKFQKLLGKASLSGGSSNQYVAIAKQLYNDPTVKKGMAKILNKTQLSKYTTLLTSM